VKSPPLTFTYKINIIVIEEQMDTDYTPITLDGPSGLTGEWWRQPPYYIIDGHYAPYRGQGLAPQIIKAKILRGTAKKGPSLDVGFDSSEEGLSDPKNLMALLGEQAEWYSPVEEPGLLDALVDVGQSKLKPPEFANRYGLLGYNRIVPLKNRCGGDPLDWFLAQAHSVYIAARLIEHLKEVQESRRSRPLLVEFISEMPWGPYALGGREVRIPFSNIWNLHDPLKSAHGILDQLINGNLGVFCRRLQLRHPGFRSLFEFQALIHVVWWKLADLVGTSAICRCQECGRIFTCSNPRTRFCPPDKGRTISRCKTRANVREFRKRKHRTPRRRGNGKQA